MLMKNTFQKHKDEALMSTERFCERSPDRKGMPAVTILRKSSEFTAHAEVSA